MRGRVLVSVSCCDPFFDRLVVCAACPSVLACVAEPAASHGFESVLGMACAVIECLGAGAFAPFAAPVTHTSACVFAVQCFAVERCRVAIVFDVEVV